MSSRVITSITKEAKNAHRSYVLYNFCRGGTGSTQITHWPKVRLSPCQRAGFGAGHGNSDGEELSADEMACALDPQCKAPFVHRRLRGVTATPSVRTPGSFDRSVNFAFNSADLSPAARKG